MDGVSLRQHSSTFTFILYDIIFKYFQEDAGGVWPVWMISCTSRATNDDRWLWSRITGHWSNLIMSRSENHPYLWLPFVFSIAEWNGKTHNHYCFNADVQHQQTKGLASVPLSRSKTRTLSAKQPITSSPAHVFSEIVLCAERVWRPDRINNKNCYGCSSGDPLHHYRNYLFAQCQGGFGGLELWRLISSVCDTQVWAVCFVRVLFQTVVQKPPLQCER